MYLLAISNATMETKLDALRTVYLIMDGTVRVPLLSAQPNAGMALSRVPKNAITRTKLVVPTVLLIRDTLALGHHLLASSLLSAEIRLLMGPKCATMENYLAASRVSKSTRVTTVLAALQHVSLSAETPSEPMSNSATMARKAVARNAKSTKSTTALAILVRHQPVSSMSAATKLKASSKIAITAIPQDALTAQSTPGTLAQGQQAQFQYAKQYAGIW